MAWSLVAMEPASGLRIIRPSVRGTTDTSSLAPAPPPRWGRFPSSARLGRALPVALAIGAGHPFSVSGETELAPPIRRVVECVKRPGHRCTAGGAGPNRAGAILARATRLQRQRATVPDGANPDDLRFKIASFWPQLARKAGPLHFERLGFRFSP